jgi:hypothetical protein
MIVSSLLKRKYENKKYERRHRIGPPVKIDGFLVPRSLIQDKIFAVLYPKDRHFAGKRGKLVRLSETAFVNGYFAPKIVAY